MTEKDIEGTGNSCPLCVGEIRFSNDLCSKHWHDFLKQFKKEDKEEVKVFTLKMRDSLKCKDIYPVIQPLLSQIPAIIVSCKKRAEEEAIQDKDREKYVAKIMKEIERKKKIEAAKEKAKAKAEAEKALSEEKEKAKKKAKLAVKNVNTNKTPTPIEGKRGRGRPRKIK